MNDQARADDPANRPPGDPLRPVRGKMGSESEEENSDNTENAAESQFDEIKKSLKEMSPYEFVSLLFAGMTFVAVVVTATIYFYQLREMRKATEGTLVAAKAAENAAKTAEGQLKQMVSGSEQTDRIIAQAQRIADASAAALEQSQASLAQGKSAIDSSIEATRLDQRPWVGIYDIFLEANIGSLLKARVKTRNTGKTPAIKLDLRIALLVTGNAGVSDADVANSGDGMIANAVPAPSVIMPGAEVSTTISEAHTTVTQEFIQGVANGTIRVYAYGVIRYTIPFGSDKGQTKIFLKYDPTVPTWLLLAIHNDAE